MNKLFVYGTLKEGGKWHHILENSKFVGDGKLSGFEMYVLKDGFMPMIKESPGDVVYGEIYEVNDSTLDRIRLLERQYKEMSVNVVIDGVSLKCYAYTYSDYLSHYEWIRVSDGKFKIK